MSDETMGTARLFIGSFEFFNDETEDEGAFQIAVEAQSAAEAAQKCRARLDQIADSTDNLGPIIVYMQELVELGPEGLTKGTLFNFVTNRLEDDVSLRDALPSHGLNGNFAHYWEDMVGERASTDAGEEAAERGASSESDGEEGTPVPVFWSGVEEFRKKWKLYWCETDDHDEDWFVVARNEEEAMQFHEDQEGYDEDDATAEFVCVLPASEQDRQAPWWPDKEMLLACGAEYLPVSNQDGADELRARVGSGSRAVRLKGKIYAEGDIVNNVLQELEAVEKS